MNLNRCAWGLIGAAAASLLMLAPMTAWPHGFAGKRFFPATIGTDDPFVNDEAGLVFGNTWEPDSDTDTDTFISGEWAKTITPTFGISLGSAWHHINPKGDKSINGFENLEVGAKWQFYTGDETETILSTGLNAEVGGTGGAEVGEPVSTVSPTFFFGQGMGILPESLKMLRPFAITGIFSADFPTDSQTVTTHINEEGEIEQEAEHNPTTLSWGFSVQYNLQYLQSLVKDVGLPAPFNRMIPLVEFDMSTCINRDCDGQTSGTVNPGVIWFGKYIQLGLEAQVPINDRSGNDVGILAQVHFFIDDIFPNSLGKPVFGAKQQYPASWGGSR